MQAFVHYFFQGEMSSLYESIWEALDLILIPPLIDICCQFLMPRCDRKTLKHAKHQIWDASKWQQANASLLNLSQFEACFANPVNQEPGILIPSSLNPLNPCLPHIPWLLLYHAIKAGSYEVANWLLAYGITEYHPTALAVLDLIVNHEFYNHTEHRNQTLGLSIELLLTWRVPLIIPGMHLPSVNLHRFRYSSGFRYCLKQHEGADNPLVTTAELPFQFVQLCVEYWLRNQKWTQLVAVMNQLEARLLFSSREQCLEWFQQFATIWQALPVAKRPRQWSNQPAVWLYLYQQFPNYARPAERPEFNLYFTEANTVIDLPALTTLATTGCLCTHVRIATYLKTHGFHVIGGTPVENYGDVLFYESPALSQAWQRLLQSYRRWELQKLTTQDLDPCWPKRQPDLNKFPRRHQRIPIKNPVRMKIRWKPCR